MNNRYQIYWTLRTITLMLVIVFFTTITKAQNKNDMIVESFDVSIDFSGTNRKNFHVLYDVEDKVLFPITDIFNYLKIANRLIVNESLIDGHVFNENDRFIINFQQNFIEYNGRKINFTDADILFDGNGLYLRQNVIEQAFGFGVKFDFRSFSAKITSEKEFPLVKIQKTEKMRQGIVSINNTEQYDTLLQRDYHLFRFGMADWSIAASRQGKPVDEIRGGLGLGAELLGGETNLLLNYSSRNGFQRNQQRYNWRWVDNNFKPVRQVLLGRVFSNSVATLQSPLDGFVISNTPTTVRKALGDYIISDHTNPDWIVELYINNTLISYVKADASGFYTFKVPIVYGTNRVTLRFYGPNGEERSEEKIMNMPYSMLPPGEFEYRVTGGMLLDSVHACYARAEANFGVARWLTIGGGYEYLSSISTHPDIPFGNFTIQPFSRLLITGEYAHNVKARGTLNYNFGRNVFDVNYTWFKPGQNAILYNYREQLSAHLSVPYTLNKTGGILRASYRTNVFENFSFNVADFTMTANTGRFNVNLQNYASWTGGYDPNVYSNLALGYRFWKNAVFRPSLQYNYTKNNVSSYKAMLEKRISRSGFVSLMYENVPEISFSSFNISFRYDLSFMAAYLSSYIGQNSTNFAISARGGTAFGSGDHYVYTDAREQVGRSGLAVMAFVDKNFNDVKDVGEYYVNNLSVRCSGGKVVCSKNDSIARVVGLEPFSEYLLTLDESSFENIAWKLSTKKIKVITDPNQFKKISVAIQPLGEVTGTVTDEHGDGKGRMLIEVLDNSDNKVATTLTESDGYFSYLGLKPGNYKLRIDTLQQQVLNLKSKIINVEIRENAQGDSKDVGNILLFETLKKNFPLADTINKKSIDASYIDSLLNFVLLFDFNKSVVRTEFKGTILRLAELLKNHPELRLEICGHTDSIGSVQVNDRISYKRAKSVNNELVSMGIDPKRLVLRGFGKSNPVRSNKTSEGRAMNRRVDFKRISGNSQMMKDSISTFYNNVETEYKDVRFTNDTAVVWFNTKNMYSIFYSKDGYKLQPNHLVLLNALAKVLEQNPDVLLHVDAHTDFDGSAGYNKQLSNRRVEEVVHYMVSKKIPQKQMFVQSHGINKPFNQNLNAFEKLLNRRCTFRFYRHGELNNMDSQVYAHMRNAIKSNIDQLFICNIDDKFMIQVGACKSESQAKEVAEKLLSIFRDNVYVVLEDDLYKIRVGYMKSLKEAHKVRTFIQASMVLDF